MNDNIDKNEIRKAIDRLQTEHPCGIAYDPAVFINMEAVNTIKECVDKIARRMVEDTEINVICEFAKLYLEGVKPTIGRPHGEWKKTGRTNIYGGFEIECSVCHMTLMVSPNRWKIGENFCDVCGADMQKKEGEKNE